MLTLILFMIWLYGYKPTYAIKYNVNHTCLYFFLIKVEFVYDHDNIRSILSVLFYLV